MPLVEAAQLASTLPSDLEKALGPLPVSAKEALPSPLSFSCLWYWERAGGQTAVSIHTFTFAEHKGESLNLDVYRADSPLAKLATPGSIPTEREMKPCVIVVHGGGWNSGSRHELTGFNEYLAQSGYVVAAIDYRLAPGACWPAAKEDLQAALVCLKAHATELGLDPERFVLLGRSAGGQIAEAAAYEFHDPAIRGCIAFYAPADLNLAFQYADPHDILNSYQILIDYLGGTAEQKPDNYRDSSSLFQVNPETPPTLLFHGRRDPLVWCLQSERLAAKLEENRVLHAYVELPWATHAFNISRFSPGGQLSTYAVRYFLARVTQREELAKR